MIFIYKNQSNEVVLTLDEKASTSTYDVLFRFKNEMTGEIKLFTSSDTSIVSRYNKFTITESSSENLLNGVVSLEKGQWSYTVYEMPVSSPKSLTVSHATGTLETGRVTVFESSSATEFSENEDKDTPSFE